MTRQNDLTGILTTLAQASGGDIGYRQGFVQAWDAADGTNAVVVAGTTIFNVPFLARTEALAMKPGDVVGLLRVKSQYFVIGRVSVNAGEIVVLGADGVPAVTIERGPGGSGGRMRLRGVAAQIEVLTDTLGGEIAGRIRPQVTGDGRTALVLTPPRTIGNEVDGPLIALEGRTAAVPGGELFIESPFGDIVILAGDTATSWLIGGDAIIQGTDDVRIDAGDQLWVDTGGQIVLDSGTSNTFIIHTTTSATANCVISTGGLIQRSTSSRRYKTDITDHAVDPADVLALRARRWRDRADVDADPDTARWHVGFIAEEVVDAGLGAFVDYDTDGRPDAIAYDRLTVALLALVRHQETRLAAVEAALGLTPPTAPATDTIPPRRPTAGAWPTQKETPDGQHPDLRSAVPGPRRPAGHPPRR